MPYPIYATKEDLINYLGLIDGESLPTDTERLLKRASELIYYVTFGNVDMTRENHKDAVRLATCSQVEYWLEASESIAVTGQIANSFSLGDLSMNFGSGGNSENISNSKQLSQRARMYLNSEGLMYRGLGW